MGLIAHKGIIYGSGSDVVPNPQDTATDELEKLGIDGDVYKVTDADYQSTMHTFTTTGYDTSTHKFEGSEISMSYAVKSIFSPLATVYNALKTAINDHASVFTTINTAISDLTTALSNKVNKDSVTFTNLTSSGHRFGTDLSIVGQFTGSNDVNNENTNLTAIKSVVNNLADYTEENVQVESLDDTTPYLYRKSPAIGSRVMENALVGASVVVNQLVDSNTTSVTIASGHKYIAKINSVWSVGTSDGTAISVDGSRGDKFVDLTQYFGSNTIPTYVISLGATNALAYLQSYGFLTGSLPCNTGTLESVNPSGKMVVGFNQWDEEWELGTIDSDTGENVPSQYMFRSKNFIPCLPNTAYYIKASNLARVLYYDSNKGFISHVVNPNNIIVTTPSNCHFMRIRTQDNNTTYNHDICINISKTTGTPKNGDYLPYTTETYPISQSPLRGVPTLVNDKIVYDGDERRADGSTDRKYSRVDLSTITSWSSGAVNSTTNMIRFYKAISGKAYGQVMMCNRFVTKGSVGYDGDTYESISGSDGNSRIYIVISASKLTGDLSTEENRSTAFKTWLTNNPTSVDYPLATPTTESLPPFDNPQKSFVGGTEEFITENDVPVGHQSEYKSLPALFDDDYIQTIQERAENAASKVTPYLQIMDNNVATDVNNYRIYFHSTSTPYALVNKAEMLSHRFLFIEVFYNNGTPTNRRIISSALIDPNSLDGYFYEIELSNNDTLEFESYPDTDGFAIALYTTGSYNDGDPTNYYLTIRLVD